MSKPNTTSQNNNETPRNPPPPVRRNSYTKDVLEAISDSTAVFAATHTGISLVVPNPVTPAVAAVSALISGGTRIAANRMD